MKASGFYIHLWYDTFYCFVVALHNLKNCSCICACVWSCQRWGCCCVDKSLIRDTKNACLLPLFCPSEVAYILKYLFNFILDKRILKKITCESKTVPKGDILFDSNVELLYFPTLRVNVLGG